MSVEAWHAGVWAGPLGGHDGGQKMASAMRKMAVYLGLVEDDHRYDQYQDEYGAEDEYDEYGTDLVDAGRPVRRVRRLRGDTGTFRLTSTSRFRYRPPI